MTDYILQHNKNFEIVQTFTEYVIIIIIWEEFNKFSEFSKARFFRFKQEKYEFIVQSFLEH